MSWQDKSTKSFKTCNMEKFVDIILNIFDPPSREEKRMERRWNAKIRKMMEKLNNERSNNISRNNPDSI